MAYDANAIDAVPWLINDCQTIYNDKGLLCECSTLNNYFASVVNDFSRQVEKERFDNMQFTWQFLLMFVWLLLLLVLLPLSVLFD